jgi:hypothetical protein
MLMSSWSCPINAFLDLAFFIPADKIWTLFPIQRLKFGLQPVNLTILWFKTRILIL